MIKSTVRSRLRAKEDSLSPFAAREWQGRGRERQEEPSELRTEYQRDRDRILHSKSFRRLKHKTQVFIAPAGDHYVTRLTHTLEVSQIARTIARALDLNEDLTEALALAHDLGHTPFGRIIPKAGGKVILIDVGMSKAYGGPAGCLVIEKGSFYAVYAGHPVMKLPVKTKAPAAVKK